MRQRPQRMSSALRRRLALTGFLCGGVLAVLGNQGAVGQPEEAATDMETQEHEGPVELGRVEWIRNYGEGVTAAEQTGRPMLLLFQEVPG
ncbi:MAG: hypothetical protein AAGA29_01735 [Planctomycetota bacterium]